MATIFRLHEIPANHRGVPGVTYVVTDEGKVYFTREYTRHRSLQERAGVAEKRVQWGGILDPEGVWVRRSLDFGDAPDVETRERVVYIMRELIFVNRRTSRGV